MCPATVRVLFGGLSGRRIGRPRARVEAGNRTRPCRRLLARRCSRVCAGRRARPASSVLGVQSGAEPELSARHARHRALLAACDDPASPPVSTSRRCHGKGRWRRRRDSNPRDGFPPAPLAGVCLRPLGHVSAAGSSSRKPRETRAFWKQTREICGACCTAPSRRTRQDRAWIYGENPATPVPAAFHHVEA